MLFDPSSLAWMRPVERVDDADGRRGPALPLGVAERQHLGTQADLRGVTELHRGQPGGALELEQCHVIGAVVADHLRLVPLGRIRHQGDGHAGGPVDHVVVGQDQAVGRQDHAGALGRLVVVPERGGDVDQARLDPLLDQRRVEGRSGRPAARRVVVRRGDVAGGDPRASMWCSGCQARPSPRRRCSPRGPPRPRRPGHARLVSAVPEAGTRAAATRRRRSPCHRRDRHLRDRQDPRDRRTRPARTRLAPVPGRLPVCPAGSRTRLPVLRLHPVSGLVPWPVPGRRLAGFP